MRFAVKASGEGRAISTGSLKLSGPTAISESFEETFVAADDARELLDDENSIAEARLPGLEDLACLRFFNFADREFAFVPTFEPAFVSVLGESGGERVDLSFASMVKRGERGQSGHSERFVSTVVRDYQVCRRSGGLLSVCC